MQSYKFHKILLLIAASIFFVSSCGDAIEPPKSELVYNVLKTLNNGACGASNPCVDFQGLGTYELDGQTNWHDEAFSYDSTSTLTLTVGTSSFIYPNEPPIPIELVQVDKNSSIVGTHRWNFTIENTGSAPKNTFVFQLTTSSNPRLNLGKPIEGKYILSSGNMARSATLEITARKTITGKVLRTIRQN